MAVIVSPPFMKHLLLVLMLANFAASEARAASKIRVQKLCGITTFYHAAKPSTLHAWRSQRAKGAGTDHQALLHDELVKATAEAKNQYATLGEFHPGFYTALDALANVASKLLTLHDESFSPVVLMKMAEKFDINGFVIRPRADRPLGAFAQEIGGHLTYNPLANTMFVAAYLEDNHTLAISNDALILGRPTPNEIHEGYGHRVPHADRLAGRDRLVHGAYRSTRTDEIMEWEGMAQYDLYQNGRDRLAVAYAYRTSLEELLGYAEEFNSIADEILISLFAEAGRPTDSTPLASTTDLIRSTRAHTGAAVLTSDIIRKLSKKTHKLMTTEELGGNHLTVKINQVLDKPSETYSTLTLLHGNVESVLDLFGNDVTQWQQELVGSTPGEATYETAVRQLVDRYTLKQKILADVSESYFKVVEALHFSADPALIKDEEDLARFLDLLRAPLKLLKVGELQLQLRLTDFEER
jgi:hypothetical protein